MGLVNRPRVSVIIIFLDEKRFLLEAIESVRSQTFEDWELLLVDDGSSDGSSEIARSCVTDGPPRVRHLEHPDHRNHGTSSSRNLGIRAAEGELIAFLDGDDVWLRRKLEEQVSRLASEPRADLLYGRTQIWNSWRSGSNAVDFYYPLGVEPDKLYLPPRLFNVLMHNRSQTPTTCNAIMRRSLFDRVGLFVDEFGGMFEDQVFFAKAFLESPVYVDDRTWARYRQRPDSCSGRVSGSPAELRARFQFLTWLRDYVRTRGGVPPSARLAFERARLDCHVRLMRRLAGNVAREMWPG